MCLESIKSALLFYPCESDWKPEGTFISHSLATHHIQQSVISLESQRPPEDFISQREAAAGLSGAHEDLCFRFVLFCFAVGASLFQKSNEDRRSKQRKVFSKLVSRRYARHFYCYHLPLPARRALRSRQTLNQSVHFSRDLLRTLMRFRAGEDWNFHLLSHLGTYVTEALLYALATLCFRLACQVGRGIVGFCN